MGQRWVERGWLKQPEDIFFLTHLEIETILQHGDPSAPRDHLLTLVGERRSAFDYWFGIEAPEVLGPDVRLTDPSGQPYEVVWNVDPGKLGDRAPRLLLAWEKAPDKDGGRCVLMADCKTLAYLRADEFDRAEKASPNR